MTLRLFAGLALAFVVAPLAAPAPLATAATPTPARVLVSSDEFSLTLSRSSIRGGPSIVELVNYGEDDHNLALRRIARGARTYRIGIVRPGRTGELEARLHPGLYRLWCTLAGHRARGMSATLRVRVPAS